MKWIYTIMAFIILTLSVQPLCISITKEELCSEAKSDCADQVPIGKTSNDSGKQCPDSCNPFQLCDCCPFCVVASPTITLARFDLIPNPGPEWGVVPSQIYEEYILGFWQPPKGNS